MQKKLKQFICALLVFVLLTGASAVSLAASPATLDSAVNGAAAYLYKTTPNPQVGSIGGEWAVIGLARSGYDVTDTYYEAYYKTYYKTVEQYVRDCKGILHTKKYTEYSRVILGLTAAGYDPRNVAGYDLTLPLGDFDKTIWQGLNGPIWALIALDSMNYPIPQNPDAKTQATRVLYVDEILSRQLADGGWNLTAGADGTIGSKEKADPDITGMVLQALAKYQDMPTVAEAAKKALGCLSELQNTDGGYSSWDSLSSESVVQVLVALTELGISVDDPRFVKNGKTLIDNLLSYRNNDGSFSHTADGSGVNQMATEQVLYGLVAAQRARDGKNSLYRMDDVKKRGEFAPIKPQSPGLPGKNPDVKQMPVTEQGKTFPDIAAHENKSAIEALASRGIINGMGDGMFAPDKTMTRAEFAAIIVRGLGLTPRTDSAFTDVSPAAWHAGYIGTANAYGIVNGVGNSKYDPEGTITRQEAAAMAARAAKLCGMDTSMDDTAIREMLAQFTDYVKVDSWAKEATAFCYGSGILDQSDLEILPGKAIKRCEIAQMLFNMLTEADLL